MAFALWAGLLAISSGSGPGLSPALAQGDPLERQRQPEDAPQMLIVPVTGVIDKALTDSLIRQIQTEMARSDYRHIRYVLFEIDSPGGDLEAAQKLSEFILESLKGLTTIAFVPPGKLSLAESLLVTFSAKELILGGEARLGADLGRSPSPEQDRELRDRLRVVAGARGYPSLVLDAMATNQHDEVYSQRVAVGLNAEETKFRTKSDLDVDLRGARGEPVRVIQKGERLVVSAREASEKFKLTQHSADNLSELQIALGISVAEENQLGLGSGPRKLAAAPGLQGLIEAFNTPLARFLLILCGCLAALIEVKTLGTSIAGIFSVFCFGIFFLAGSLPTQAHPLGTATLWEVILFVIGLSLFALEFLLLPGMAIFAISGAALCAVSLVLAMLPADASELAGKQTMGDAIESAIATLSYGFAGGCLLFLLLVRILARRAGPSGGLVTSATITGVATANSAIAAQTIQAELIGKSGVVSTTLRPAGKVELAQGQVLDVVTLGEYIEKGTRVRVASIESGVITVTRESSPNSS